MSIFDDGNGIEHLPPGSEPDPEVKRMKTYGILVQDFSDFIDTIKANRKNDFFEHTYFHEAEMIRDIALPKRIAEHMTQGLTEETINQTPTLEAISTTIGTFGGQATYLSMDIITSIGDYHISRSGTEQGIEESDSFTDRFGNLTEIGKIPTAELNLVLMSLIHTDSQSTHREGAEQLNYLDSRLFDVLNDALTVTKESNISTVDHVFNSGAANISITFDGDEPISFNFNYLDPITKNPVIVQNDIDAGIELKFYIPIDENRDSMPKVDDLIRKQKKYTFPQEVKFIPLENMKFIPAERKMKFIPTSEELARVIKMLADEKPVIEGDDESIVMLPEVELLYDGIDPEIIVEQDDQAHLGRRAVNDAIAGFEIDSLLDELGFDSPDSGAA